jgi:hypothetical protein
MSAWRRKALELLPEYKNSIEKKKEFTFSVYQLFFDLQPIVVDAYKANHTDLLKRIYEFAEWCWNQKRPSVGLHEAAVVAFYEHLIDAPETRAFIPHSLNKEIFEGMRELFKARMPAVEYQYLLTDYDRVNGTNFVQTV